jgi:putative addiction module killer protein
VHRSVGSGLSEMKIDLGPGYRIYYTIRKRFLVFVLCGGDKSTQDGDIKAAKKLADSVT